MLLKPSTHCRFLSAIREIFVSEQTVMLLGVKKDRTKDFCRQRQFLKSSIFDIFLSSLTIKDKNRAVCDVKRQKSLSYGLYSVA